MTTSVSARRGVSQRIRFWIVAAILILCAMFGGSARGDMVTLLALRPLIILLIAATLLVPGRPAIPPPMRWPIALLGLFGIVIAIQLVPLPPSIWKALPGHATLAEAADAVQMSQPWRPISMSPDLTLNSLISLLVPLAVLLSYAALDRNQRSDLVPLVIGIACASALVGILQMTAGRDGLFSLYGGVTDGLPSGLLANRNHQALLLAMTLPLLARWATPGTRPSGRNEARGWIAMGIGIALLPLIVATGSRSGLVLTAIALVETAIIAPRPTARRLGGMRVPGWGIYALPVVLILSTALLGRGLALERIVAGDDLSTEQRITAIPVVFRIIRDFLPFGTGFGTFDRVFRMYEPDRMLTPNYFNHAHNDLLELVMTGGVMAGILLILFAAWACRAGWRRRGAGGRVRATAMMACSILSLAAIASLTDYPLRTPLLSAIMALACGWLSTAETLRGEEVPRELRLERP